QERYIDAALHEITRHLILGSILASLVVLLFMRSWRSTLIAAIAIPCSVISTFGMMRVMNFTLNGVTMLALVLMVGVVIDDAVVVIAIGVALSSIPLYRVVKQEYIPTDVDEAEFDVNINAPEGTNIDAMNEAVLAAEEDLMSTPGVRLILSSSGGSFLGAVNQASVYVRIAPHEERVFSLTKFWNAIKSGHPLMAFRGNYTQRDVMQEVRQRLQKYAPLRF